ncbi:MAG: AraC family transcriptional regulator [Frankiales bacterium]|jgi:AraC family transcriptional regulator of adaptative response / DNA-3-methyladenine glycosylase II|nr:AraC family transcriptional regulator [Frankiales bacterium]
MELDADRYWHAVESSDSRFDGWFFCGVTSTGIYCRPSCPARTPKRVNVRFYATAAAAQAAGFRACKRCRPDATPGSPEWDRRGDLVGRAMRLIADGVVDRDGVNGLARQLGYTERHVHRELVAVAGAGPLALARAQRAQTARVLIETTQVPLTQVAFAAGFQSVRQFNAVIQEVFATTPRELRTNARSPDSEHGSGAVVLRLPYRAPFDGAGLIDFLGHRAVPGVEQVVDSSYRRSLRLPHGTGVVELTPADGHVQARFVLADLRDLGPAVQRCRALLDLDSDPLAVTTALGADIVLGKLVTTAPGRRVPGHVDGHELAIRAVLGQQVSLASAATLAGRLVATYGERLDHPVGAVTHLFPNASALADADPDDLAMPQGRRNCVLALARALATGAVTVDVGADRDDTMRRLHQITGVGSWTVSYIAMRALRDPDVFLPTDLGVRHALESLGLDGRAASAARLAESWRPYRAYAVQHLWAQLPTAGVAVRQTKKKKARVAA